MPTPIAGRIWFGATASAAATGIVVQLVMSARSSAGGSLGQSLQQMLNMFAFFTIQSNLILGTTCLLLAMEPLRRSTPFQTLRLDGVLCIAVTGIVHHVVLAGDETPAGAAAFTDLLLHTVTPVAGVLGWLVFGPRGQTGSRIVAWSMVFPLAWLAFTLIRGAFVGFYPYPFLDVSEHGYPAVLRNLSLVAILLVTLAAGLTELDRLLARPPAATGR